MNPTLISEGLKYGEEPVTSLNGFSLDFSGTIFDVVIVERATVGAEAGDKLSKAGAG